MGNHINEKYSRWMRTCCILLFSFFIPAKIYAQTFNYKSSEASGIRTASQLYVHALPDTITVWSNEWNTIRSNPSTWGNLIKLKSNNSFVKFAIDHYYPITQRPYTYQLSYSIYGYYQDPNVDSTAYVLTSDTLTITNFNHNDELNAFQDIHLAKYSNYYKTMVVITGIYDYNSGSPVAADLSDTLRWNFTVESAIQTQRYDKSYYGAGTSLVSEQEDHAADNYLKVYFSLTGGTAPVQLTPVNYELEWTYVDDYERDVSSGTVSHTSASGLNYMFSNNNTRVWLDSSNYRIPLVYQNGYIVYRVRMVRPDTVLFKYPIYSDWSYSIANAGNVGSLISAHPDAVYHISDAYMHDSLNWQYTISFAEGGKYKHVLSFYDGLLKNRESITRFNSNLNKLIVTKNVYDFEGRPAIKTLPAPVSSNAFSFRHNVDLNSVTSLPYKAGDFDTGSYVCPGVPALSPLASNALANIYYSNQNPDTTGVQRYVPDAEGFPLVHTIYSPAFNDRIEKQGGAGPRLQVADSNIISNYYVSTFQRNINRLFGQDIGWNSYYNQTISRDPNQQLSMSIKNYEGKQIASSLIGTGPSPLTHALTTLSVPSAVFMYENILMGLRQERSGTSLIAHKDFFNQAAANDSLQYFLKYPPFVICPGSLYLKIKAHFNYQLIDPCGDTVFTKDSVIGVNGMSTSADVSLAGPVDIVHLGEGEHHVRKELHFSTEDVDDAIDSFVTAMNDPAMDSLFSASCLHSQPWFVRQAVRTKIFPCAEEKNPCEEKRAAMLEDLFPGGKYGAYTGPDTTNSVFMWIGDTIMIDVIEGHYLYQDSCVVMDLPDTITVLGVMYTNLRAMPRDSFIYVYSMAVGAGDYSIAEALMPLHPEYCMMKACFVDTFKTQLLALPNAAIAEQMHLLYLDSLIAHDPFGGLMSGSAYDSLSRFPGGWLRLDSPVLLKAYCGCGDTIMFGECVSSIFSSEISRRVLVNDYVKGLYFKDMIELYLQNRQRFVDNYVVMASGDSCAQCDSVRLELRGSGTFPRIVTTWGTPTSGFLDSFATGSGAWILGIGGTVLDSTALAGYADSASSIYSTFDMRICTGTADSIVAHLANCAGGDTVIYNRIHATLDSFCAAHLVHLGEFTPDQIRHAILASGASLDDFCNPYLIGFGLTSIRGGRDIGCLSDNFYTTVAQFLNENYVMTALINPGTNNTGTLTTARIFENNIFGLLGTTSVVAQASYDATKSLYTLYIYPHPSTGLTDTAKIYLRGTGTCANFFSGGSIAGHTIAVDDVLCVNTASPSMIPGYINEFTFLARVTESFGGSSTTCNLLGWTDSLLTMADRNSDIATCIPCTEMRKLYAEARDTMTFYGMVGADHPYYDVMLMHFMNYRLGQTYSADQYNTFITSCALADSTRIPLYVGYGNMVFPAVADADSFIRMLNAVDPVYNFDNVYRDSSATGVTVCVDFNIPPLWELYLYRNAIRSFAGTFTTRVVDTALAYIQPAHTIGFVYADQGTHIPDEDTLFGTGSSIRLSASHERKVWMGGSYNVQDFYYVIDSTITTAYELSRATYELPRYFFNHSLPANFVSNYLGTVNADYYKPKKTDFLHYTYNYQTLPPYQVLDSLQAQHLVSRIPSYSYSQASYNQPFNPNVVTNLYISDTTMKNRYFDTLVKILHWVADTNTVNPGHIFFNPNKVVVRSVVDSPLIAYRCADGTYWYRYFGHRDTMYNVYVAMPPWIPQHEHPLYELVSVGPPPDIMLGLGDSTTRFFTLNLHKTGDPTVIQARGMTNFVIGKNIQLSDVLLGNPITTYSGRTAHDTFQNCERDLLNSAIREGTLTYRNYIDSIVFAIRSRCIPYLLTVATEKLNVGYWNQEFNYTLYYYDRAGNLTKTVPPAGVNFVPSAYWAPIDTARILCTTDPLHEPAHTKTSTYNYNSINQVVNQNTPDAGETKFFYDPAGRLIFSQNEKQKTTGYFTYNLYDKQNRIIETGEAKLACPYFPDQHHVGPWMVGYPPVVPACYFSYPFYFGGIGGGVAGFTASPYPPVIRRMLTTTFIETPYDSIVIMIRSTDRRDVVMTVYDTVAKDLYAVAGYGLDAQANLRKRVAAVKYFKSLSVLDTFHRNYHYANHYSYDIAGNVKSLVQEYPALDVYRQRYKRVDYDYDLISGKVNLLSYNRSFADQFYQRYAYDDDNRISKVETSNDGIIWKRDAEYTYYEHGPLARIDLGDLRVQGIDFAYTIQGWLKVMNGDTLNTAMDMGEDGNVNINAHDAAFYSIDYFKNDYKPITSWQMKHVHDETRNLYNGNISRQTMAMHTFQRLNKQYIYDQLNRIYSADYSRVNAADSSLIPITDYHSKYTYDMDGNIQSMLRYGNNLGSGAVVMDSLTYYYGTGIGGYTPNELKSVVEKAADIYDLDIRHNFAGAAVPAHYQYDAIGNTIKDLISGQDTVKWNLYNKVTETHNNTANNTMQFDYDGAGNRVGKYFEQVEGDTITERNDYWVHDAQGNILARYRETTDFRTSSYRWISIAHSGYLAGGGTTIRYLRDFVASAYGPEHSFQERALSYAMGNSAFKSYMLSRPVSYFMEHSNNLYNNMVGGDINYVMPLVEYEQAGTDTLLGPAVAQMAVNHPDGFSSMMLNLLENPAMNAHALGLTCRTGDPGDTLMAHLALAVGVDDTVLGCDSMAVYLTDSVDAPVLVTNFVQLIRQPGAPLGGYSQWLVSDTNIYNEGQYTDTGGVYQTILQAAAINYADRAKMRAFFDVYPSAANLLTTMTTEEDLLRICYNADLPAFLTAFDSIIGSATLDSALAEASVMRTPMAFSRALAGATVTTLPPDFWVIHDTVLTGYGFGLAEHDFYGSSRLGIKTYWPGQIGAMWDVLHHTADTIRLWERKPWYSADYQDVIKDTMRDLYGNTHKTPFTFKHINGQRQYEVTDHLGDVLATLSDARNTSDTTTPDTIQMYTPVVHSAYDYYPFGMYMPGRHTEDSATHCNWFTQTQTIRVYDTTWLPWTVSTPGFGTTGSGTILANNPGIRFRTNALPAGLTLPVSVTPGTPMEIDLSVLGSTADYTVSITEGLSLLGSTSIPTSTTGVIPISFTPSGSSVTIDIGPVSGGLSTVTIAGHWVVTPRTDTVTVLTSVCSGERYPYGFNGKLKDNEWAGKGNHYSYDYRMYDTRISRFKSIDPATQKYPWWTPYQFAGNSPVENTDKDGKESKNYLVEAFKAYLGIGQISNHPNNAADGRLRDMENRAVQATIKDAEKMVDVYQGIFGVIPGYTAITEMGRGHYGTAMGFAAFDLFGGQLMAKGSSILLKPLGAGAKNYVAGLFKTSANGAEIFKGAEVSVVKFIKGTNPTKTAVIGQDMARVNAVADGLKNAEKFVPSQAAEQQWNRVLNLYQGNRVPDEVVKGTQIYAENQVWIKEVKAAGYDIMDIGAKKGEAPSTFYNMETLEAGTAETSTKGAAASPPPNSSSSTGSSSSTSK